MKLGKVLIEQGHTDSEEIKRALEMQDKTGKAIGEILIDLGFLNEIHLRDALLLQSHLRSQPEEDTLNFLRKNAPFNVLPDGELSNLASTMTQEHFLPGKVIIDDGETGSRFYVIKEGRVKCEFCQEDREIALGYLEEGEYFADISLLTGLPNHFRAQATEFTTCLVQNKGSFDDMVMKHPRLFNIFGYHLLQRIKIIYKDVIVNPIPLVEPFVYRRQVNDLLTQPQVFCNRNLSIRQVAAELITRKASTAIIVNDDDVTLGLVGLREMVNALAMEDMDPSQSIESIVRKDYCTIAADDYFFDAIYEMMKHTTSKLVVMSQGKTRGIITGLDLLRFRGRDVLSIMRNIENAPDYNMLNLMRRETEKVLKALISDGATASHACKILSTLYDKVTRRVIGLVLENVGQAPAPFAWLGLGSEGRKEQTLLTDQDNGIIFAGSGKPEEGPYFEKMAHDVVEGLSQCGFPICKGDIMATNAKYSGTLEAWKKRVEQWIFSEGRNGNNLIDIYVFLDFRAIYGDESLARQLRSHIMKCIVRNSHFLEILADSIISVPVPLGLLKNFIVEKNGKYKNSINLKNYGLLPLTSCFKILAYHYDLYETNTLERMKALKERNVLLHDQAELFEQAFETFLTLKIKNSLSKIDEGTDSGNYVNPNILTYLQKQALKEAFSATTQAKKTTRNILMTGSRHESAWSRAEVGMPC